MNVCVKIGLLTRRHRSNWTFSLVAFCRASAAWMPHVIHWMNSLFHRDGYSVVGLIAVLLIFNCRTFSDIRTNAGCFLNVVLIFSRSVVNIYCLFFLSCCIIFLFFVIVINSLCTLLFFHSPTIDFVIIRFCTDNHV